MSRGPGRVQKIIADLIASNPHGAWSVTELCKHIYPDARMEKKHRVAVTCMAAGMGSSAPQVRRTFHAPMTLSSRLNWQSWLNCSSASS